MEAFSEKIIEEFNEFDNDWEIESDIFDEEQVILKSKWMNEEVNFCV